MSSHELGERFGLLDKNSFLPLELSLESLGGNVTATPTGVGDTEGTTVWKMLRGEALRPPSPAHLKLHRSAEGALRARWVRRSRLAWAWLDAVDSPLGESLERYRIQLDGSVGSLSIETGASSVSFSTQQLASVGSGSGKLSVVQLGDYSASHPATASISL